jgi:hypothetical protein
MKRNAVLLGVALVVAAGLLVAGLCAFFILGIGNPLGVALCVGAAVTGIVYTAWRNARRTAARRS